MIAFDYAMMGITSSRDFLRFCDNNLTV